MERLATKVWEAPDGDGKAGWVAIGAWNVFMRLSVASEYDGGGTWLSGSAGCGVEVSRSDVLCDDILLAMFWLPPFRDNFPLNNPKRDILGLSMAVAVDI